MKRKTGLVCAVLLAAGILAFVQPIHAGYEAVSHAVVYDRNPLIIEPNPCADILHVNPRGYAFQQKWSTYIDNYEQDGKEYSIIRDWTDSQVWGKNWTDPDFFNWGEDNVAQTGTDWADVIMYFGHGGACCDGTAADDWGDCETNEWFSRILMGNYNDEEEPYDEACLVYSHYKDWYYLGGGLWTPVGHMALGYNGYSQSRDANFLMLLTCHGGEYCSWEGGGWDLVAANGSMNMILGFHGQFMASDDALENFDTFMANSCCSHAGNRWVENLMSQDGNCAIVMGWGKSHSAIEWPIYNYQAFLNFKDKRPPTYTHYYFKEGCDPTGEISDLPDESPAQ